MRSKFSNRKYTVAGTTTRVLHFCNSSHTSYFGVNEKTLFSTLCGKTSPRSHRTKIANDVTCPRCVEDMKKSMWYCPEHGFIDDAHVTNDEKCDMCGNDLN